MIGDGHTLSIIAVFVGTGRDFVDGHQDSPVRLEMGAASVSCETCGGEPWDSVEVRQMVHDDRMNSLSVRLSNLRSQ